jgi:hypothetical protein
MNNQQHRFWTHGIILTTAIVFGLSIFIAPQALAGSKGKAKGHNKEWKQEKAEGKEYRKTNREMERKAHKYGQEQEHGARKAERNRDMEERQYGQESDREDRQYSQGQDRGSRKSGQED